MLTLIVSGCNGRMGQAVSEICMQNEKIRIAAGFDLCADKKNDYPIYLDPAEFNGRADVLIDFSNPACLSGLLRYCTRTKTPAVLCTTGYNDEEQSEIKAASEQVPIFQSGNMSLGINLLADLVKKAVAILGTSYDIEIVERHHREKIDAPSGTAYLLAQAARDSLPFSPDYVYERQSVRTPRDAKEIGISAVRGGTIVGEHEVIFAGLDEVVELKHVALSRNVFANGAVSAAKFMATITTPGLYRMDHLISK